MGGGGGGTRAILFPATFSIFNIAPMIVAWKEWTCNGSHLTFPSSVVPLRRSYRLGQLDVASTDVPWLLRFFCGCTDHGMTPR